MDVRLEDGTVVTNVPEGITQSELLARLGKSQKQDSPRKPIPDIPMSGMEKFLAKAPNWMSSDIPNRFAQGAADPTIGAAQLVTNIAANGRYAPLADKMNQFVKDRDSTLPQGFDPIRLAGSFASPFAFASKIAPSATTMGRVYQGGMLGGASGLTNPVSRDDYAGSKMSDTLFGTAAGALLPLGWESLKAVGRVGRNVYDAIPWLGGEQGIKDIAGRMLNKAGGDKTDDILRQIELGQGSPVPGMQWNAGQKAVPVGSAEFSGLIDIANRRAGSIADANKQAQEAARTGALSTFAKDDAALAEAFKLRSNQAAGDYATAFSQQVKVDPELARIMNNPYIQKAIPTAMDLAKAAKIDPKENTTQFLQYVKSGLDKQLAANAKEPLGEMEKAAATKAKSELLRWLDARNVAFKEARNNFQVNSVDPNQMMIGQFLRNKLNPSLEAGESARAFADAMRNPQSTIKSATGNQVFPTLDAALLPQNKRMADAVLFDLQNNARFQELAKAGAQKSVDIAGVPHLPQTGILDPKIGLGRAALNAFIGKEHGKVLDQIAKATPEQIAEMMKNATPAQRQMLLDQFFRAQSVASGQLPN